MKENCWEFKKCGREPGGSKVATLGVCPATTEKRLTGCHGGENGGRACWIVGETLCGGEVQGNFGAKAKACFTCDFYKLVKKEEQAGFMLSANLMKKLK